MVITFADLKPLSSMPTAPGNTHSFKDILQFSTLNRHYDKEGWNLCPRWSKTSEVCPIKQSLKQLTLFLLQEEYASFGTLGTNRFYFSLILFHFILWLWAPVHTLSQASDSTMTSSRFIIVVLLHPHPFSRTLYSNKVLGMGFLLFSH